MYYRAGILAQGSGLFHLRECPECYRDPQRNEQGRCCKPGNGLLSGLHGRSARGRAQVGPVTTVRRTMTPSAGPTSRSRLRLFAVADMADLPKRGVHEPGRDRTCSGRQIATSHGRAWSKAFAEPSADHDDSCHSGLCASVRRAASRGGPLGSVGLLAETPGRHAGRVGVRLSIAADRGGESRVSVCAGYEVGHWNFPAVAETATFFSPYVR